MISDLSDAELRTLRLALNKLSEYATWDEQALRLELTEIIREDPNIDLEDTGFEIAELDSILDDGGVDQEDELPVVDEQAVATTQLGDQWKAGDHIIRCDDALKSESYSHLLGSLKAGMVFTDPPYNVEIAGNITRSRLAKHHDFAMAKGEFSPQQFQSFLDTEAVTTASGGRLATSVGGSLTGRGGDMIIVDDPLKAEDAQSELARSRVLEWFRGTLLSRLNDKEHGQVIVLMQRLHQDDLSGHLLETGQWTQLILPAIATVDTIIRIGPQRVIARRAGEVLHPERESRETFENVKSEIGSQRFSAQYQQQPVPQTGNYIKSEWLKYYEQLPIKKPGDRIVQSWDTAYMPGESNDFSVCTTWLKQGADFYLLDVFRDRLEFQDLCRKARSLARDYCADTILIEKVGLGCSLLQELQSKPPSGRVRPIGIVPKGDKRDRLIAVSPRIEAGQVHFPAKADWCADFVTELLKFPYGRHDDQVDSLSQFLHWATRPWFEPPPMGVALPIYGD